MFSQPAVFPNPDLITSGTPQIFLQNDLGTALSTMPFPYEQVVVENNGNETAVGIYNYHTPLANKRSSLYLGDTGDDSFDGGAPQYRLSSRTLNNGFSGDAIFELDYVTRNRATGLVSGTTPVITATLNQISGLTTSFGGAVGIGDFILNNGQITTIDFVPLNLCADTQYFQTSPPIIIGNSVGYNIINSDYYVSNAEQNGIGFPNNAGNGYLSVTTINNIFDPTSDGFPGNVICGQHFDFGQYGTGGWSGHAVASVDGITGIASFQGMADRSGSTGISGQMLQAQGDGTFLWV